MFLRTARVGRGQGELPVWPEEPKIADHPVMQPSAAPTITMDYSQAPDLEPVAMRAKEVLLDWYPRISEMLPTEGYGQAASLLNHVQTVYTDVFVAANDAARRNVYTDQLWVDHTGKDTETLWNEAVAGG